MSGDPRKLDDLWKAARELSPEDLPDLIGQLEAVKATAWARLTAPAGTQLEHDELLDVSEAAHRLCLSPAYLYRHYQQLPFTRRMGRKLLFSSTGIDAYLKRVSPKLRT